LGLQNYISNRSYAASYTISAANTWEFKALTIPGDTSGTWLTDNSVGIRLFWDLGSGSSWDQAPNTWSATNTWKSSSQASWISTNGATFYITGVQLEAGTVATPFERRSYGQELSLCQRYYQAFVGSQYLHSATGGAAGTTSVNYFKPFLVEMRSVPTFTFSGSFNADGAAYIAHSNLTMNYANTASCRIQGALTGATSGQAYGLTHDSANSRLSFNAEL
jgi:hypothetical protein